MEQHRLVTLSLPVSLIARIEARAHGDQIAPAEVIRRALIATLAEGETALAPNLMAARAVQEALAGAAGWLDLQHRLRQEGVVLRLRADRLALNSWPADRFILWLDDLGETLADLTLRFRAPFPGAIPRRRAQPPPDGAAARDIA